MLVIKPTDIASDLLNMRDGFAENQWSDKIGAGVSNLLSAAINNSEVEIVSRLSSATTTGDSALLLAVSALVSGELQEESYLSPDLVPTLQGLVEGLSSDILFQETVAQYTDADVPDLAVILADISDEYSSQEFELDYLGQDIIRFASQDFSVELTGKELKADLIDLIKNFGSGLSVEQALLTELEGYVESFDLTDLDKTKPIEESLSLSLSFSNSEGGIADDVVIEFQGTKYTINAEIPSTPESLLSLLEGQFDFDGLVSEQDSILDNITVEKLSGEIAEFSTDGVILELPYQTSLDDEGVPDNHILKFTLKGSFSNLPEFNLDTDILSLISFEDYRVEENEEVLVDNISLVIEPDIWTLQINEATLSFEGAFTNGSSGEMPSLSDLASIDERFDIASDTFLTKASLDANGNNLVTMHSEANVLPDGSEVKGENALIDLSQLSSGYVNFSDANILGTQHNDILISDVSGVYISGGDGDDHLGFSSPFIGQYDVTSTLVGGAGADTFYIAVTPFMPPIEIHDFNPGEGDTIELSPSYAVYDGFEGFDVVEGNISLEFNIPLEIEPLPFHGQVILSDNGLFSAEYIGSNKIEISTLPSGGSKVTTFDPFEGEEIQPYGNFQLLSVDDAGDNVFFSTWNGLGTNSAGGVFSYSLLSGETKRLDADEFGNTITHQGWSLESEDFDVTSDGSKAVFSLRHLMDTSDHDTQFTSIFLKDLITGQIQQIDHGASGTYSSHPRISNDGKIVFNSNKSLKTDGMVDGTLNSDNLYLFDSVSNVVEKLNIFNNGEEFGTGGSAWSADISGTGEFITFNSMDDLKNSDSYGHQVYTKSLLNGEISLISNYASQQFVGDNFFEDGGGIYSKISSNGEFIAYQSGNGNHAIVYSLHHDTYSTVPDRMPLSDHEWSTSPKSISDNGFVHIWTWDQWVSSQGDNDHDVIVSTPSVMTEHLEGEALTKIVELNYSGDLNSIILSTSIDDTILDLELPGFEESDLSHSTKPIFSEADFVYGSRWDDLVEGGDGDQTFNTFVGFDKVDGGDGTDTLVVNKDYQDVIFEKRDSVDYGTTSVIEGPIGFNSNDNGLTWTSADNPELSLDINETQPTDNFGNPSYVNGYNYHSLSNGNIAVVWNAATLKTINGNTVGIQDVYARIFNPVTGEFITGEINLTNAEQNQYFEKIEVTSSDFLAVSLGDDSGHTILVKQDDTTSVIDSPLGLFTIGSDLIWTSYENPDVSIVINETMSRYTDNLGNSFSPNGHAYIALDDGNLAVIWNAPTSKTINGDYYYTLGTYARFINPITGEPITDEIRLASGGRNTTDSTFSSWNATSDGSLLVGLENSEFSSGNVVVVKQDGTTSVIEGPIGFNSNDNGLTWTSADNPELSLDINETQPTDNFGNPSYVNGYSSVSLNDGNIAVVWNAATLKTINGNTDGIQDVYARIFNPVTGEFITGEINLTNAELSQGFDNVQVTSSGSLAVSLYDGSSIILKANVEDVLVIVDPSSAFEYEISDIEFVAFKDKTISFSDLMEPFLQKTPSIDVISDTQTAAENVTSSLTENKLTGISIDKGENQDIAQIEMKLYFTDVATGDILPFSFEPSDELPEGVNFSKVGFGTYKVFIQFAEGEVDSVVSDVFDQLVYSSPEDLAGSFKGHIDIRNKNATNDWSDWKSSEFDLAISPISEVPLAEIDALSDLNHDGNADNHPNFYVNKDVLLKFDLASVDADGSEEINSVLLSGLKDDATGLQKGSIVDIAGNPVGTVTQSGDVEFSKEEISSFLLSSPDGAQNENSLYFKPTEDF
ncbi:hypothetical protein OAP51_04930, partial [Alphaproteobacteria bacterium]|nr:hypothetical protein [Alphaproteobacteria bacterium]